MKKWITIKIKDVSWKVNILKDQTYEEQFGKDSLGITHKYKQIIVFKESAFTLQLIRHELLHAYVASCCIGSISEIDDHAMEELCAEIIEFHVEDIVKHSRTLYNKLKSKKSEET